MRTLWRLVIHDPMFRALAVRHLGPWGREPGLADEVLVDAALWTLGRMAAEGIGETEAIRRRLTGAVKDHAKAVRRRRRREGPACGGDLAANARLLGPCDDRGPVDALIAAERRAVLLGAMAALPSPRRRVLVLRLAGASTRGIAAREGLSEAEARAAVRGAVRQVRALLRARDR